MCFRYQIQDYSGEILNEVTAPLAEKPIYAAPISLPNGNRHKTESKIKVKKEKTGECKHISSSSGVLEICLEVIDEMYSDSYIHALDYIKGFYFLSVTQIWTQTHAPLYSQSRASL